MPIPNEPMTEIKLITEMELIEKLSFAVDINVLPDGSLDYSLNDKKMKGRLPRELFMYTLKMDIDADGYAVLIEKAASRALIRLCTPEPVIDKNQGIHPPPIRSYMKN